MKILYCFEGNGLVLYSLICSCLLDPYLEEQRIKRMMYVNQMHHTLFFLWTADFGDVMIRVLLQPVPERGADIVCVRGVNVRVRRAPSAAAARVGSAQPAQVPLPAGHPLPGRDDRQGTAIDETTQLWKSENLIWRLPICEKGWKNHIGSKKSRKVPIFNKTPISL